MPRPRRYRGRADKFGRLLQLGPRDWSWATQAYYSGQEWMALSPLVGLEAVTERHREVAGAVLDDGRTPLAALAECDRRLFLPGLNLLYGDRASMRASVELRVPFLGEPVVACALGAVAEDQLRLGNGKARFRAAAVASGVPSSSPGVPRRGSERRCGRCCVSTAPGCGPRCGGPRCSTTCSTGGSPTGSSPNTSGASVTGASRCSGLFCAAVWWECNVTGGPGRASDVLSGYTVRALG